jgi:hypothetical protein
MANALQINVFGIRLGGMIPGMAPEVGPNYYSRD